MADERVIVVGPDGLARPVPNPQFMSALAAPQPRDAGSDERTVEVGADGLVRPAGPTGTALSPEEEAKYQAWKATLPPRLQYEGDYDLRGFYKENPTFSVDQPGQHMTDKFKLPNHETFSNESMYYNDATKHLGGAWQEGSGGRSIYVPNDPTYKSRVVEDANGERIDDGQELAKQPDFITALASAGRAR